MQAVRAGFSTVGGDLVMTAGDIRLTIGQGDDNTLQESYFARDVRGRWQEMVRSPEGFGGATELIWADATGTLHGGVLDLRRAVLETGKGRDPFLRISLEHDAFLLEKIIAADSTLGAFQVRVAIQMKGGASLRSAENLYRFRPADGAVSPDFTWTPCLRPGAEDCIADHSFRSPAVIVRKEGRVCALIPDLDTLREAQSLRTALDLACPEGGEPRLSFGFANWRPRGHVYFERAADASRDQPDAAHRCGYYLLLRTDAAAGEEHRPVSRFLWERFGRSGLVAAGGPLAQRLEDWEQQAFVIEARRAYEDVNLPWSPGGILKSGRARWSNELTDRDAWFSACFQSVRTACGLLRYGRAHGRPELEEKARSVVDLILKAPRKGGIFPTIFSLSEDGLSGTWATDSGWAGHASCYHAFDCSWTGCWLLSFAALAPSYQERVLSFLVPYGDFLLKHQLENGCIPSFYDGITLKAREELIPHFGAETAGSALFLARLHTLANRKEFLEGAQAAMAFVDREAVKGGKWFDFETFLSCSRKPFDFVDPYTLQLPQSTLCMMQAAWAYLELYRATQDPRFLEAGQRVLDYLALHQQVWSPPFFSRSLLGGFGVQNTDAQWSDARSSYGADLFFDYFDVTLKREYFERGAAALQASFVVLPYENWGHSGKDEPGGKAGIHWGIGSAAASSVLHREKYGDIRIDLSHDFWACPLNACAVENLEVDRFRVAFDLVSSVNWRKEARVRFAGLRYKVYELRVNGGQGETYQASELEQGVLLPVNGKRSGAPLSTETG